MALLPLRAILHHFGDVHPLSRRVLILGTTELAGKLAEQMLAELHLIDLVVGIADDDSGEFKPAPPTLRLGSIENLGQIIETFEPDVIVCATDPSHDALLLSELLKPRARGVPVEDGIEVYERLTGKTAIEAGPRAILFSNESAASWIALFLARAMSAAVALVGLVLLFPFLLPIALLIKLDSEGPVFSLHERIGLRGRPFKLIKFRTARTGGARSVWVGHWLRRFRLDALPQLLNILQGDMNLVGPRPHATSNVDLFTEQIPYYGVRCSVRPGITGWAQIRYGHPATLEEEAEEIRYDLHYIRHLSPGLDLRILLEALVQLVRGRQPAMAAEGADPKVVPIYFGIEHPRRSLKGSSSPPVMPSDDVVSIGEWRTHGHRAWRDVA